MVSVEPVMDFDLDVFASAIKAVNPTFVYVGYDNYYHKLPEPELAKTKQLGTMLEAAEVQVRYKVLREPIHCVRGWRLRY